MTGFCVRDRSEEEKSMRKNNVLDILRIAAVLCLICGIMAGLLAVINGLTKTRIAANEKQKDIVVHIGEFAFDNALIYRSFARPRKIRSISICS